MLVYLGICAALSFLAALVASLLAALPASTLVLTRICLTDVVIQATAPTLHIVFAAGIMPLIFGAVIHFVPVLTRTAQPGRIMHLLPLPVQMAGFMTPLALGGILPKAFLHLAAGLASLAAVVVIIWMMRRFRGALGSPHPGASWYGASLLCLFFAVSLVPVWLSLPELRPALRLFHLHLNTLGFIGLAALGTLPVLLPTALGRSETQAGRRLQQDLLPAVTGALLVAAGAAGQFWLSVTGTGLLLWVMVRTLIAWQHAFGLSTTLGEASAAPLAGATIGLAGLLLAGVGHAAGILPPRLSLVGFLVAFLLPLVTGALAQLLPVWLHPGPDSTRRQKMHALLIWGGEWRALLFVAGGTALVLDSVLGVWPLLLGLLWFLVLLLVAFNLDSHLADDDNPPPNSIPLTRPLP